MSTITIPELPNSSDLDINDYLIIYNTEASPDVLTYKGRIGDVLNLLNLSVNGKSGTTITITPDDLHDSTTLNKFVTASDKTKIALVRTDQGSGTFLAGDGTYRTIGTSLGNSNYTVNTISDRDSLSGLNNGDRVLVIDASADPDVTSGAALYYWNSTLGHFVLIADEIALDFVFQQQYTGTTPTTRSVGGVPLNYQLTGKTANQILERMLTDYLSPTFFLGVMDIPFSSSTKTRYDLVANPTISVGTPLSGNHLFCWGFANQQNVKPNSISVKDITNNVYLATGLTSNNYNGYNMGSATVNIGTIPNSSPMTHSWVIEGTDTKGNVFKSSTMTITSV